jgi:uncharacterized protein YbjT (DUF2867 family)
MTNHALIVGASGIVGSATADVLVREGWQVSGLARKPVDQPGVTADRRGSARSHLT